MDKTILRFSGPLLALALVVPALAALADDSAVPVTATHLVGIPSLKSGERAKLTVQDGTLQVAGKAATVNIKLSTIEDILTSTEATQAGGNAGTAARVGAMAAPYDTGAVLTLILWTKVDLMTVLYRGDNGGLHSILLTVPKGKAEPMRSQLLAAGAHASERKP
jgi:hypothetical protein